MHIKFLIEDSSGKKLLEILLPKILGEQGYTHSWKLHSYKGVGHLSTKIQTAEDAANRQLLNQLPKFYQVMVIPWL